MEAATGVDSREDEIGRAGELAKDEACCRRAARCSSGMDSQPDGVSGPRRASGAPGWVVRTFRNANQI